MPRGSISSVELSSRSGSESSDPEIINEGLPGEGQEGIPNPARFGGVAEPAQKRNVAPRLVQQQREEQELIYRPYFIYATFVLNVIMFFVSIGVNGWKIQPLTENPMIGPTSAVLEILGAKRASLILQGDFFRFFTPMYLHAGLLHLLMNMVMLLRMGRDLEKQYGAPRIMLIYFLAGIFGVLMSCLFIPDTTGVGASGALYGLLGAMFGDFYHNHMNMGEQGKGRYICELCFATLLGLCMGLMPMLDNFAHIGGWLAGLISSFAVLKNLHPPKGEPPKGPLNFVALTAIGVLIVLFASSFGAFYGNASATEWCQWCQALSCIPTPLWECSWQKCRMYSNGTRICPGTLG